MQYSSNRRPRRAKRTSASRAAGRSETPSPMKTIRGMSPSGREDWAVERASLMERALSWPRAVSCLQTGFYSEPSGAISASLATISMWADWMQVSTLVLVVLGLISRALWISPLLCPKTYPELSAGWVPGRQR